MPYLDNISIGGATYDLDNPLFREDLPGTTQEITFSADGNVQFITHKSGNTAIRTDTFTFGTDTITEVRTLNTGETLTIVTNTTSLQTTVTYTAA